ncbi:Putative hypothetical protein [Helicobacter mustelae 12198]|uniref:Uncharacterized protein n=1 Tax=Helicobacter mustelae (strain ATCC 43772 / CCUG 25715 / CIP 103759 / LMG 18044 / NCTC 12198 / R85-136P) TaxID=679897 RepID=D3UI26_HELM1|nr:Putative hypothetical protein [Helicobacter mustelae 12198]
MTLLQPLLFLHHSCLCHSYPKPRKPHPHESSPELVLYNTSHMQATLFCTLKPTTQRKTKKARQKSTLDKGQELELGY